MTVEVVCLVVGRSIASTSQRSLLEVELKAVEIGVQDAAVARAAHDAVVTVRKELCRENVASVHRRVPDGNLRVERIRHDELLVVRA